MGGVLVVWMDLQHQCLAMIGNIALIVLDKPWSPRGASSFLSPPTSPELTQVKANAETLSRESGGLHD